MNGYLADLAATYMSRHVLNEVRERSVDAAESILMERAQVISGALESYFYLLDDRRRHLKSSFTESELSLLCDACNGIV